MEDKDWVKLGCSEGAVSNWCFCSLFGEEGLEGWVSFLLLEDGWGRDVEFVVVVVEDIFIVWILNCVGVFFLFKWEGRILPWIPVGRVKDG